jgi:hypothetical protein
MRIVLFHISIALASGMMRSHLGPEEARGDGYVSGGAEASSKAYE